MDILGLGQQNNGVFSRHEALEAGETDESLAALRRHGIVTRLRRGMYVLKASYDASDDSGKHLMHARAELAAQWGEVALCGPSAAALHGFAIHGQDLSVVHLVRLDDVAGRRTSSVNHHRVTDLTPDEVAVVDGVRVVTPARAVWEVACAGSLESGVVTADSALRLYPGLGAAVAELGDRFAYVPGSRRARIALRLADPRAESPGESITRVQCYRYGIPRPELQHEFHDDRGELIARTDFWWSDCRHVGEFDGSVKYVRLRRLDETVEQAVIREKRREDEVRAQGCGMTRFIWSTVMPERARRTMAELSAALERSRRLYVLGLALA